MMTHSNEPIGTSPKIAYKDVLNDEIYKRERIAIALRLPKGAG
jgi:hypothetical protein